MFFFICPLVSVIVMKSSANVALSQLTVYNYHLRTGIPEATRMMAAEARDLAMRDIDRIVGGRITDISEVPYQAGLVIKVLHLFTSVCGGSLISPTKVVTAAHCNHDGRTKSQAITVVLGSSSLFSGGVRFDSNGVILHHDWNANTTANDLAIVFIPPVNFSDIVRPINLPNQHEMLESFLDWTAIASGYGFTKSDGAISKNQRLSSVQLPIISNEKCQDVYGEDFVNAKIICSAGTDGHGTCNGDSGGPLAVNMAGRTILIGITSFGARAGCEKGFPAAYSRVTSYVEWICATSI